MNPAPSLYSLSGKKVWVAGHRGMVGSALLRQLQRENCQLLTVDRQAVDLTRQQAVERWIGGGAASGDLRLRGESWRDSR